MELAYIISAYKYPEQLIRLILRLTSDKATFFVHVDKKTCSEVHEQMVNGTKHLPNVYFLKRYRCDWGDFGHVRATMEGIHETIQRKISFDYAILLTGQDYPIKTIDQIEAFLQQHNGKSFMAHFPLPSDQWENGGLERVTNWHVRMFHRHYVFPKKGAVFIKRKFPKGFQPFGGSSYWCLTRDCIEYIYRFIQMNSRFVGFFRYVDVPDEIFFQTILMNSPFAGSIVSDDCRYIEWKDPNSGSPSILDIGDYEKIANSPKLFARKFDASVDTKVLDLIDGEILACG